MISPGAWMAAVAGLLLGSFLNVCIARLPQHRSIVWPGSHCPRCCAPIRPWDNLPLLSFVLLRGRCRSCHERIAWRYPAVEAALAVLWGCCFALFSGAGRPALLPFEAAAFCFLLLGLLAMDAETFLLPDAFTVPGAVLGLASAALPGGGLVGLTHLRAVAPFPVAIIPPIADSALGLLAAPAVLLLVRAAYRLLRGREGMGLGDIKLAAMLGSWLGLAGVGLSLVLGVILGGVLAMIAVCLAPEKARRIPLGMALCAAAFITLFAGQKTLKWYFHFWR